MYGSCAIGRGDEEGESDLTWHAYAKESHHNISKFSFVSVYGEELDGTETTWYARIIAFLKFSVKADPNENSMTSFLASLYVSWMNQKFFYIRRVRCPCGSIRGVSTFYKKAG